MKLLVAAQLSPLCGVRGAPEEAAGLPLCAAGPASKDDEHASEEGDAASAEDAEAAGRGVAGLYASFKRATSAWASMWWIRMRGKRCSAATAMALTTPT